MTTTAATRRPALPRSAVPRTPIACWLILATLPTLAAAQYQQGGQAGSGPPAPVAGDRLFGQLDANSDGLVTADEVTNDNRRLYDRLLRRGDRDGDGALSATEFAKALTPDTPAKPIEQTMDREFRGADALRLLLLKLDTNRDTRLTRGEAPADLRGAFDELLAAADRNDDGELDRGELSRGGRQLSRRASQIARRLGMEVEAELATIAKRQGPAAQRFEQQQNPRQMLASPQQAAALYKQLDSDSDGRLTEEELPGQAADRLGPLLRRADTNRDGGVSEREFVAAARRVASLMALQDWASAATPRRRGKQPKAGADRAKPSGMRDSMADTDTPGRAAGGEDAAAQSPRELAKRLVARMVARMDGNGDGQIARGEASGRLAKRFDAADANGDGVLDKAELRGFTEQLRKRLAATGRRDR